MNEVNENLYAFVVNNPLAAYEIGLYDRWVENITSTATRFASRAGLQENPEGLGSEVNAFRHALWQAIITARFGEKMPAKLDMHTK